MMLVKLISLICTLKNHSSTSEKGMVLLEIDRVMYIFRQLTKILILTLQSSLILEFLREFMEGLFISPPISNFNLTFLALTFFLKAFCLLSWQQNEALLSISIFQKDLLHIKVMAWAFGTMPASVCMLSLHLYCCCKEKCQQCIAVC
ncbi:hypothetical protein D1007_25860 [Hordeum vulgare]|nr:hypothetical protein D1007_25860 [Hordeum vulgare]